MFFTDNIITLGQTYRWIPSYREKKTWMKSFEKYNLNDLMTIWKKINKHVLRPSKHDYNPNWTEFGRFWTNMLNNTCHLTVTLVRTFHFRPFRHPFYGPEWHDHLCAGDMPFLWHQPRKFRSIGCYYTICPRISKPAEAMRHSLVLR